jgi:hypothetical protein
VITLRDEINTNKIDFTLTLVQIIKNLESRINPTSKTILDPMANMEGKEDMEIRVDPERM